MSKVIYRLRRSRSSVSFDSLFLSFLSKFGGLSFRSSPNDYSICYASKGSKKAIGIRYLPMVKPLKNFGTIFGKEVWAFTNDSRINLNLIENFIHRSLAFGLFSFQSTLSGIESSASLTIFMPQTFKAQVASNLAV